MFTQGNIIKYSILILGSLILSACDKSHDSDKNIAQVTVSQIKPKDTPIVIEFIGQTQSSHQVEIRARVNGFLDKQTYTEGTIIRAGTVMFQMDPKPFKAQLNAQKGALAQQEARLKTAKANLSRVRPLVKLDALSQKDLDDATGKVEASMASVEIAKANVENAALNLSYTTISTPITGLSSYARVQDGTYINTQNNLLTYVYQLDPMWVNFSVSENDLLKYRRQLSQGILRTSKEKGYSIEVILADGELYPNKGELTFADAEYNQQTGTFLVRATIANPKQVLRPGQFLRVHLLGGMRPSAIVVPQQAVFEGANGHFVWIVDKDNKAQIKNVEVGSTTGNQWFIDKGLQAGDKVIVDGMAKLTIGAPVQVAAK